MFFLAVGLLESSDGKNAEKIPYVSKRIGF